MSREPPNFSLQTVGILGGMGPAATVNFQRLLVAEINATGVTADSAFPRIITLSLPLREWDHTGAKDKAVVGRQVRNGMNWLLSHGARIVAVPCNTVHEFLEADRAIVNILDETLACCAHAKTVGVLCSAQARLSRLYERNEDQRYVYLPVQNRVDDTIAAVMAGGRPNITGFVEKLVDLGADVVVLGCTELSLCERVAYFPFVVDSSQALAEGVVRRLGAPTETTYRAKVVSLGQVAK